DTQHIDSLLHLGPRTFDELSGEVVQNAAFVISKDLSREGIYFRLVDGNNCAAKRDMYLKNENRYTVVEQKQFEKIPGSHIAYWVSKNIYNIFSYPKLSETVKAAQGLITSDNDRFLRLWYELDFSSIGFNCTNVDKFVNSGKKWAPFNKAGSARKWWGNQDFVVNWENNGYEIKNFFDSNGKLRSRPQNVAYYFHESISWSDINTGLMSFRYFPSGFIYDGCANSAFNFEDKEYLLAYLNSPLIHYLKPLLNPTIHFTAGNFGSIPYFYQPNVSLGRIVTDCIAISKQDWDAHETSWDFQRNGLLDIDAEKAMSIVNDYCDVSGVCINMAAPELTKLEWLVSMNKMNWEAKFLRLHANEEELNRQFIEIYGLQDELNSHVDYEDITILQQGEISLYRPTHGIEFYGDKEEAAKYGEVLEDEGIVIESQSRILWQDDVLIKQLISYMVGVWMGRYRLDRPGLNIAHPDPTEEEMASYQYGPDNATLVIDDDAIIPILPTGAPFEDNLTEYIANFVRIAWGEESQTDNLNFIEQCLGKKIEDYVQKDFWKDHKKMYQNRPIYWLFSSKKGAFKALVYVHRMHPYTVEQVRTRYLLKYMDWLRSEAQRLEIREADLTTAERRRLDRLRSDIEECEEYHERLQVVAEQAIPIDLDNGIPANHALFGDIVTKLK
ncbi:MAG: BREX-1 system adenine-specific DNA-methyltransferase PglX, partial [Muribaculaceae bacterium]|nr:BREX-1 system adenine-specific DNA-methyltransferase PglX [Muribaculaceae bacterium]